MCATLFQLLFSDVKLTGELTLTHRRVQTVPYNLTSVITTQFATISSLWKQLGARLLCDFPTLLLFCVLLPDFSFPRPALR